MAPGGVGRQLSITRAKGNKDSERHKHTTVKTKCKCSSKKYTSTVLDKSDEISSNILQGEPMGFSQALARDGRM